MVLRLLALALLGLTCLSALPRNGSAEDHIRKLQTEAIEQGHSPAAHWGTDPSNYTGWGSHSNRLVPVFTYGTQGAGEGVDLASYTGERSVYRSLKKLTALYGREPEATVNKQANYLDQTEIYELQKAAVASGKRHVVLMLFDGMDWDTIRATAIHNRQAITYQEGRGTGTYFQEYDANGTSQFGYMVTSPYSSDTEVDVDTQQVAMPEGKQFGGYNANLGGQSPWEVPRDPGYLISSPQQNGVVHAYTDSAPSAGSMTAGIKSYNNAITVDPYGRKAHTIAHELQADGWTVGIVSNVPISHASPGAAYAHNVSRHDYQDISRDLLGLPSVSHPQGLPGMDIVVGAGWGSTSSSSPGQGSNFVPGNKYLADSDLAAADIEQGGKYVVAQRAEGTHGGKALAAAARKAAQQGQRLLGFYGTPNGNLPYQTANGDYQPAPGRKKAIEYSEADLWENPTLAEMTAAALTVAEQNDKGFWLMIEAGDVDWANHDNNLDNAIGAVNSGDAAFRVVTQWVERHSSWNEALVIVTADHGHLLVLDNPELLIAPKKSD